MKRHNTIFLFMLALAMMASVSATAQITDRPIEMRLYGGYVYNYVLGHSGNFDLQATLPINKNFNLPSFL